MSKSSKYSIIVEAVDDAWRAQIVRQVTSRKVMVSKSQDGFASEELAQAWAAKELEHFTKVLEQSNKRQSEKRQAAAAAKQAKETAKPLADSKPLNKTSE